MILRIPGNMLPEVLVGSYQYPCIVIRMSCDGTGYIYRQRQGFALSRSGRSLSRVLGLCHLPCKGMQSMKVSPRNLLREPIRVDHLYPSMNVALPFDTASLARKHIRLLFQVIKHTDIANELIARSGRLKNKLLTSYFFTKTISSITSTPRMFLILTNSAGKRFSSTRITRQFGMSPFTACSASKRYLYFTH
jgi:hypothetical protein